MKNYIKYFSVVILFITLSGCKKDFLEKKPNKEQVVPETLSDLQALLDDTYHMNESYPASQEIASDNYYLNDKNYNAVVGLNTRNAYIWHPNVFNNSNQNDWALSYVVVFYSNLVLETLEKITPNETEMAQWNSIKGSALFFRGLAFYNIAQLFAKPYSANSAATDLGIVLRLKSDINEKSTRSTLQETYDRVIQDLNSASNLLPITTKYKTRPSSTAANALLARVFLSMGNYGLAGELADHCLKAQKTLLDYNLASKTSIRPFARFNDEVIFHCTLFGQPISLARIDPNLFNEYDSNDLRKTLYFRLAAGTTLYTYKGSYDGGSTMFGGLATDELYLIRAECLARAGNLDRAMEDLNTLLKARWNNNVNYPILVAANTEDALSKILKERRKELIFRGLRWSDLRRLNLESEHRTTLKRELNGNTYELTPESSAYVFQIPDVVIQNTGIQQNDR